MKTHGQNTRNSRIYRIWNNMKRRVQGRDAHNKKVYADKGITVCDEWQEFMPFYEWAIASGYRDDLSIDRIDSSKGYFPENCRWATVDEQHRHLVERKNKYGRGIKKRSANSYWLRCYDHGKYYDFYGFKTPEEAAAFREEWRAAHGYY